MSKMTSRVCWASVAGLVLSSPLAYAQAPAAEAAAAQVQDQEPEGVTRLNAVVVSATRTDRALSALPNTVSVITQARVQEQNAAGLKALLEGDADIAVPETQSRFTLGGAATGRAGVEGVTIRGLGGDRVLMTQDGVRLPNSFSFGPFATGRGDFTEVEALKSIEVLRGPTSAQFGSDGLAGAVTQRTLEPQDLLRSGRDWGGLVRAGYAGVDRSWLSTVGLAAKGEQWQGLLLGTLRRGHETANKGDVATQDSTRTKPDPMNARQRYVLGKVQFMPSAAHRLGLSFETLRRQENTEVFSARAVAPVPPGGVLNFDGRDTIQRDRLSFDYQYVDASAAWVQKAQWHSYWQDAQVNQYSDEDKRPNPVKHIGPNRTRDNTYRSTVMGASLQLESNFVAPIAQRLSYGLDASRTYVRALRDGTHPPSDEVFPSKPFADTHFVQVGAFVQSEMEWDGLSVIPGLRWDHYALRPSANGYSKPIVSASGHAFSPKLGVVWKVSDAFAPYVQLARGFKMPQPHEVNTDFNNPMQGYASISNPNLKPERVQSLELGLRGKLGALRYAVAAFDNRYQNFISQEIVGGRGTPTNPIIYQYINLERTRIKGVEARLEWQFAPHWRTHAEIAYAKGTSKNGSEPLDSVNPLKVTAGLRYHTDRYGVYMQATHSAGKSAGDANGVMNNDRHKLERPFLPHASTVVDLGGHWKLTQNWLLNVSVNNLFDRRYWRWSDVRGVADSSTVLNAYSAPGRNFRVALSYQF